MQLESIVKSVQSCENLLEKGEYEAVLDGLDDIEGLIAGRESKIPDAQEPARYLRRDLRRLKAMEGAFDDLQQLRSNAGRGYEARFHDSLVNDIRRHVDQTED